MTQKSSNFFLYLASSIGNLIAFSVGAALSWTSPMLPKLNGSIDPDNNPLDRPTSLLEDSWIAALLPLGAVSGPIFLKIIADRYGRKKTLVILAFPLLLSLFMMAFSEFVVIFIISRFIAGVGVGGVFTILPMYSVEISEDHNRGTLSCLMTSFVTLGILFSYVMGPLLTVQNFCLVSTVPLIIFIPAFMKWNPESPTFFALIDDQRNLKNSLIRLRRKNLQEIEKDVSDISNTVLEMRRSKGGIKDLFTDHILRRALLISVSLMILQQFCGITAVTSYMQTIFDASGSSISPEISTIIIGFVQFVVVIVTSSLVDRLGRRILFLLSSIGSGFSLFTLGLYFFLKDKNFQVDIIFWLPIVSLIIFIIAFNSGLGPLPWTIMAELFPPNVVSLAATITTIVCFTGNFTITVCFPSLSVFFGMAGTFWIFSFTCFITTLFIYWVVPETKAKSIQEIQNILGRRNRSTKSNTSIIQ